MMKSLLTLCLVLGPGMLSVQAATHYTDLTLSADCATGNYSTSSRTCTGSDGKAYNTILKCVQQLAPDDTCLLRGGTYTERIDLQGPQKQGTAGHYITVGGYPGETVVIQCADPAFNGYGCVKHRGNLGWFIIQDIIVDGTGGAERANWWVGNSNHDVIIRRVEVRNFNGNGFYLTASTNILIEDSYIHSSNSLTCTTGTRWHGFYVHDGSNYTFRRNTIYNMPGIAYQIFPGPLSNVVVDSNDIHNNTKCDTVNNGAVVVYSTTGSPNGGGPINNVTISNNLIHHNGLTAGGQYLGGGGGGIVVRAYTPSVYVQGLRIEGNTIAANEYLPSCSEGGCTGYGIYFGDNNLGAAVVKNNILAGNEQGAMFLGTGNMIVQNNACLSGETCGTTGKVALTSPYQCFLSSTDYRLASGTNPCVDAGVSVASRPTPVRATDLGAFERGSVAAANALAAGGLEVEFILGTQGVRPPSGPSGASVACAGCIGSPTVTSANVKPGSSNTLIVELAGITSNGGCTLSISSSTTITDGGRIGYMPAYYQPINQEFGLPVNGTCKNSSASSIVPTWSLFTLDEGSGTTATDSSGNSNHGTVAPGVTWVNNLSGTGITIPPDATYRAISTTFGAGINPTTQGLAKCVFVLPNLTYTQKVVFSSGSNGVSQRWYAGWTTVGGQPQWGIGIQGSGFITGSEFPVVAQKTLVCLVSDSATATAYLWVDGVKGAQAGKSVKAYTSYMLTGNLVTGHDGTNTVNNGGFTVYEDYTWNSKPSDADIVTLFGELTTVGGAGACYSQVTHQAQLVHLNPAGAQVNYGQTGMSVVEVIDGGAVYLKIQIDCTGSDGTTITPTPYYSLNGSTFSNRIPGALGADGIAMWGQSVDATLNRFDAACCLSGALTPNNGVTILTESGGQAITLLQNHSYTIGLIVTFAPGQIGKAFWIKIYQGNGQALAGGYTPSSGVKVTIVSPRESGVF